MQDYLTVANSPILWGLSLLVVGLVVIQALLYLKQALNFSKKFELLTVDEKKRVYQTAVITSIGPAVAVFIVSVSLVAMIGAPMTLLRIGVIGSAVFEIYASAQGATAMGVELGGEGYDLKVFTNSVWAMTLGGAGWIIATLILTKRLGKAQAKMQVSSPKMLLVMGVITPAVIFFVLTMNSVLNKTSLSDIDVEFDKVGAALAAAVSMLVFRQLGKAYPWLKEWGLGFGLLIGLAVGQIIASFIA
jgi:Domain of unknown function (DUF5058)